MAKKKLKLSNRITDHLINAILIFASVLLAFWMNEIREEKQKLKITNIARETVITELKNNLDILERWEPYHKDILEKGEASFFSQIDTISEYSLKLIPGFSGIIQKEIITTNGLKLLDDSNLKFDIPTRMMINKIYQQHSYVLNASSKISNELMQRESLDETKVKENYLMFYILMADLYGQENALIARLKETINELEE